MGDVPVLSVFFKKPLTQTDRCAGALSCRKNCLFSIFQDFCFWPHPQGDEGCQFTFLHSQFYIMQRFL